MFQNRSYNPTNVHPYICVFCLHQVFVQVFFLYITMIHFNMFLVIPTAQGTWDHFQYYFWISGIFTAIIQTRTTGFVFILFSFCVTKKEGQIKTRPGWVNNYWTIQSESSKLTIWQKLWFSHNPVIISMQWCIIKYWIVAFIVTFITLHGSYRCPFHLWKRKNKTCKGCWTGAPMPRSWLWLLKHTDT